MEIVLIEVTEMERLNRLLLFTNWKAYLNEPVHAGVLGHDVDRDLLFLASTGSYMCDLTQILMLNEVH